MFCQNCGNELSEGLRFCGKCGAPVSQDDVYSSTPGFTPASPVNNPASSADPQVDQSVPVNTGFNVVIPEGEREIEDNSFLNTPSEPPKRKKKRWVKILAIVLSALIVLGSCGFLFRDYLSSLWYWTKSNDEKLQYAFKKQATATTGNIADLYSGIIDAASDEYSLEGSVSAEISQSLLSMAGDSVPFNSMSVEYSIDYVPGLYAVTMSYMLGEDSLLSVEYYIDFEKATATVLIPELNSQAVQVDVSDLIDIYGLSEDALQAYTELYNGDFIYDILPDEELIEKLMPRLVEVAFMQISDVSDEKHTFTAGDVSESLTLLTADITENTVIDMIYAILGELKTNSDVKEYIYRLPEALNQFSDYTGTTFDAEALYSEYSSALDEILAEAETVSGSNVVVAQLRTYIDFNFNIKAIEFEVESAGLLFSYGETSKGNKSGTEIKIVSDGVTLLQIVGSGTEKSNKYSGEMTINASVDGYSMSELLVIKYDDYNLKTAEEGIYSGEIEIFLGSDLLGLISGDSYGSLGGVGSPSLLFKFDDTENSTDRSIIFKFSGMELLTLKATSAASNEATIEIPSGATDDLDEWSKGLSFDYFTDLLKKWGIPLDGSSYGDFSSSYGDSDYSDYYDDYYDEDYSDYSDNSDLSGMLNGLY